MDKPKPTKLFIPKVNSKYGFLQFFSDPNPPEPPTPNDPPKPTHTDEDVQRMIAEALAKAQLEADEKAEKERQESERKKLEEQEKYKELYETLEKQLADEKVKALDAKKETLLVGAGYSAEQVVLLKGLLNGETDEQLNQSLEAVKVTLLPKGNGADPNPGNHQRQTPSPTDPVEKGKSAFQRLKEKGKIRN